MGLTLGTLGGLCRRGTTICITLWFFLSFLTLSHQLNCLSEDTDLCVFKKFRKKCTVGLKKTYSI